jgi:hypothetical protein
VLARWRGSIPFAQQIESLGQSPGELVGGQHPHQWRRQLQRERDPVQSAADRGHGLRVVSPQLEATLCRLRSVHEQLHGLILDHSLNW